MAYTFVLFRFLFCARTIYELLVAVVTWHSFWISIFGSVVFCITAVNVFVHLVYFIHTCNLGDGTECFQ